MVPVANVDLKANQGSQISQVHKAHRASAERKATLARKVIPEFQISLDPKVIAVRKVIPLQVLKAHRVRKAIRATSSRS